MSEHHVAKIPPYVWVWKSEYSSLQVAAQPPICSNHFGFVRADIVAERNARIAELEAESADLRARLRKCMEQL